MARTARKKKERKYFRIGRFNIVPSPGYLVVKPLEAETRTATGIYLPESAEEKPQKGKVVAVGGDEVTEAGAIRKPPAGVGDEVIYKKWGGNEVKVGETEYLFSKFEDILAVIK